MQLVALKSDSSDGEEGSCNSEVESLNVLNYPLQDDHRFKCEMYEADVGSSKEVWETDARAGLPARAL